MYVDKPGGEPMPSDLDELKKNPAKKGSPETIQTKGKQWLRKMYIPLPRKQPIQVLIELFDLAGPTSAEHPRLERL